MENIRRGGKEEGFRGHGCRALCGIIVEEKRKDSVFD